MKRFSNLIQVLMTLLIISACGGNVPPTANPIDFQGTLLAAGATGIALTQAAIPTPTPQPTATVTNTPAPTATFVPLPTQAPPTAAVPGAGDPCITTVLPASLNGPRIKIRIDNPTKAALNITVYLQQARPQGQCGYRAYSLDPQQSLVINDLVEGCYSIWAWNPDPKDYFMVTNGTDCLNSSAPWAFDISTRSIELKQ